MKRKDDFVMLPKKIPKLLFRALLDAVILLLDSLSKDDDPWEKRKKY